MGTNGRFVREHMIELVLIMSGQSKVISFTVNFLQWLIKQFQTVQCFFTKDISVSFKVTSQLILLLANKQIKRKYTIRVRQTVYVSYVSTTHRFLSLVRFGSAEPW